LARYLDATGNTNAMPDMCYEKCKSAVDAVMKRSADICEGAALASALLCLEATGIVDCSSSVFSNNHAGECDSNNTVRTLEESEDAMEVMVNEEDAMEVLVNETPQTAAATRNMMNTYGICKGEWGEYLTYPTPQGLAECMRWKFNLVTSYVLFEIGWMRISQHYAFWLKLQLCKDAPPFLGIVDPLYAEVCLGGSITFTLTQKCPILPAITIEGKSWLTFEIGLDFWVTYSIGIRISFAQITLGVDAGIDWATLEKWCWWVRQEGWGRRRWFTRRRRSVRKCTYRTTCDLYVKGYLQITILISKAVIEFIYWVKNKNLQIFLRLEGYSIFSGWSEAYSKKCLERYFR